MPNKPVTFTPAEVQQYIDKHPDAVQADIAKAFGVAQGCMSNFIYKNDIRYAPKGHSGHRGRARTIRTSRVKVNIAALAVEAREQGMSYGQYVALKEGALL